MKHYSPNLTSLLQPILVYTYIYNKKYYGRNIFLSFFSFDKKYYFTYWLIVSLINTITINEITPLIKI